MTDNDYKQIKLLIIDELRKIYPKATVSLWFEPMRVVSLDNNIVTISLPDTRKAFVETQYADVINIKFSELLGFDTELRMITTEEEAELFIDTVPEEKIESSYDQRFNPEYTFENFVVGKSNQLAHSAALTVAKHPSELNNPLYFYGPSGLGKTHLMFAIVAEIRKNHPEYNILYVTGEDFTNDLVESLAKKKPVIFREKYRKVDVLLVDDIQFIEGKVSVQEEFFHTFDTLFKLNRQIILASDRAPKDINLEDRLKSRFVMGLIADVQPPDLELRIAIFKRKAMSYGIDLDLDVLMYLAQNITTNIRQIEGALKKLKAHTLISGQKCDYYVAKEVLSEFFIAAKSEETVINRIFEYTQKRYGVSIDDIKGIRRTAEIIAARHFAVYLVRNSTKLSQNAIARLFNRKDHTTVINSTSFIERKMKNEPTFEREIQSLLAELNN